MSQINKYPWLVRMEGYYSGRWASMCGGTLVASKYVITAAHCVTIRKGSSVAKPADEIRTIIGDHNLFSSGEELIQPKTVNAKAITSHPSYTGAIATPPQNMAIPLLLPPTSGPKPRDFVRKIFSKISKNQKCNFFAF